MVARSSVLEYEGIVGGGVINAVFSPRKGRFAKPFDAVPSYNGAVVLKYRLLPGKYVVVNARVEGDPFVSGGAIEIVFEGMRVLGAGVLENGGTVSVVYDTGVKQVFLRHIVRAATRTYSSLEHVFRWLCRRYDTDSWQWLVDLVFDNTGKKVVVEIREE